MLLTRICNYAREKDGLEFTRERNIPAEDMALSLGNRHGGF